MVNNYVVKEKYESYVEVEKSKFYGIIFQARSKEEFVTKLEEIKKEYPKARHYCYAYIFANEKKASDNGEPGGTAGKPILNILETQNLTNTAIVVVRYFGGTLLGAGRLTRTYSLAAQEAFKKAKLYRLVPKTKVRVFLELDTYDNFINFLSKKHYVLLNSLFNDKITIDFLAESDFDKSELNIFLNKLTFVAEIPYTYEEEVK